MPKMKRKRSAWDVANAHQAKRRRTGPSRAYRGSRVPLRSGGYRPNRTEKKVADTAGAYAVNTTGAMTLLAIPVLGSDMDMRIGRKIQLRSFYMRGRVVLDNAVNLVSAVNSPAQQLRCIIFIDLQPNGGAPLVTDLLKTAEPSSQLNLNNRDRFKVLIDKQYCFDPFLYTSAGSTTTGRVIQNIKKYKKMNQEVVFNATNCGSIADINTGAFYMLWIGSLAAGTNDSVAFVTTRTRYDDK